MSESDSSDIKVAMVIRGNFTRAEFATIIATVRELDQKRPDAHFEVVAVSDNATVDQMAEVLKAALPDREGRETSIVALHAKGGDL
jgi:hypothetical protein